MAVNVNIPKPTYTKSDVGLGNVDNTSDLNKPISTATQTALNNKVDKVTGKSLIDDTEISRLASMTAIFTSALKTAYDGVVTWIATNGSNILSHLTNTSNPHSTTATQVDALKRDGSNANSDVDLGTYSMNTKSVKVNGTAGAGHVGLKHQSVDATASGSETVIFAGSDGEPRYKNAGGTVAQFASRGWVIAQGYITSVIAALGYTPENVANKQSDLTASSTKYPTVDAVNTGLATKQNTLTDANFGTFSNGLTAKTTPVDADTINLSDSADSNKSKKLSFTNLKAFLKTYFDTIYTTTSAVASQITTALSSYVPTTRTINGYDLSANRALNASDVSAVASNGAITGATKTKITYDSKGLVTSGTDATTADIADSTNKRYVTDAQLTILGNTSNTNTGDETQASILSKLGIWTVQDQTAGTASSGTTQTITKSIALPSVPNFLNFRAVFFRNSGTTNTFTARAYLSEVNNNIGGTAVLIATVTGANSAVSNLPMKRTFDIISGNILGFNSGGSTPTDDVNLSNAKLNLAIPTGTPLYLIFTVQCANASDSARFESAQINNFSF